MTTDPIDPDRRFLARVPAIGSARCIGRVGALAVALGIGAALANNTGIAVAETPSSASADSGSSTGSGSTDTGQSAEPSDTATAGPTDESSTAAAPPTPSQVSSTSEPPETSDPDPRTGVVQASGGANTTVTTGTEPADDEPAVQPTDASTTAADDDAAGPVPQASDTAETALDGPTAAAQPDKTSYSVADTAATAAPNLDPPTSTPEPDEPAQAAVFATTLAAAPSTVSPSAVMDASAVTMVTDPPPPAAAPPNIFTGIMSGLISAIGFYSQLTDSPVPVPQDPTLWAVLGWVRREIDYRLFNATPTTAYNWAENSQTADGAIVGDLHAADANGDTLTYTLSSKPRQGTVTVNDDGTFVYTPTAELKSTGGSDSFSVTVDDWRANPLHVHGLATVFAPGGGASSRALVTVLVTPAGADSVSTLGNPDQIAAEQRANQIVSRPAVKLAEAILRASWLSAAQKQFALVGGPDAENLDQLDAAVHEYALMAALEQQSLDPNNPKVLQLLNPPHTWYGQSSAGARIFYDNPDTIYRLIPVNTASSYVITGHFDGELPADTGFSVISGFAGTTVAYLSGKDIALDPDGKSFTITVDSSPGGTNHIQVPDNAAAIVARNTLSDWSAQAPMSLTVQRVSGPPDNPLMQIGIDKIPVIGPLLAGLGNTLAGWGIGRADGPLPIAVQAIETAVIMGIVGIPQESAYIGYATTDQQTGQLRAPNTLSTPGHVGGFLATQLQSAGYFQLADDQALVVTIDPGNANYFVVPVTNDWTITDNYWDQQTSLNNVQATPNADGTYTVVISPTDPGVANWVSTGGLNQGTVFVRFQDLDPQSAATPSVSTQLVSLDELSGILPPGAFITDAERAAQLQARRDGYDLRYAPYPQTQT